MEEESIIKAITDTVYEILAGIFRSIPPSKSLLCFLISVFYNAL